MAQFHFKQTFSSESNFSGSSLVSYLSCCIVSVDTSAIELIESRQTVDRVGLHCSIRKQEPEHAAGANEQNNISWHEASGFHYAKY